jgi:ATP-binding cassette subfamily F protein 3
VVFVSHDRYFIDKLATRVFEIGDGHVDVYPGNYEDYLWRKQGGAEALQKTVAASPLATAQPTNGNQAGASQSASESKSKRLNPIKRKQMQARLQEVEQEIADREAAIAQCEASLQTFVSAEETQRLTQELADNKAELKGFLAEWEELGQVLQS